MTKADIQRYIEAKRKITENNMKGMPLNGWWEGYYTGKLDQLQQLEEYIEELKDED